MAERENAHSNEYWLNGDWSVLCNAFFPCRLFIWLYWYKRRFRSLLDAVTLSGLLRRLITKPGKRPWTSVRKKQKDGTIWWFFLLGSRVIVSLHPGDAWQPVAVGDGPAEMQFRWQDLGTGRAIGNRVSDYRSLALKAWATIRVTLLAFILSG